MTTPSRSMIVLESIASVVGRTDQGLARQTIEIKQLLVQQHNRLVHSENTRSELVKLLKRLRRRIDYNEVTNELTFDGGEIDTCEINEDLTIIDRGIKQLAGASRSA